METENSVTKIWHVLSTDHVFWVLTGLLMIFALSLLLILVKTRFSRYASYPEIIKSLTNQERGRSGFID